MNSFVTTDSNKKFIKENASLRNMVAEKDKFGLDLMIPKSPAKKAKREKEKIKLSVPLPYKAVQKTELYERVKRKKRKKTRKKPVKKKKTRRRRRTRRVVVSPLYSRVYEEHKNKITGIVSNFFTQELGVIVEWFKDMTNVKKKVRKTLNYHAFLTAGLVVLLFGIAKLFECFCVTLICGLGFIIVGLVAIIIAIIYNRYY